MRDDMAQKSNTILKDSILSGGHEPLGKGDWTSPFIQEFFMVQGNGFRCMAYRNQDGKWHGAFDHEVLPGAIRVLG